MVFEVRLLSFMRICSNIFPLCDLQSGIRNQLTQLTFAACFIGLQCQNSRARGQNGLNVSLFVCNENHYLYH